MNDKTYYPFTLLKLDRERKRAKKRVKGRRKFSLRDWREAKGLGEHCKERYYEKN